MITGDRNIYIAGHVTKPVREALERIKDETGVSLSEQLSLALEAKLKADGLLADDKAA